MIDPLLITKLLPPEKVVLIIVGQDPYSGYVKENTKVIPYFDGIAFSSMNTIKTPNQLKVLKRTFKYLSKCKYYPNDLSYLVSQGVYLINT